MTLRVEEDPDIDTDACFTHGLELVRNLFEREKLDSRGGTRGFRSTAGAGLEIGTSDVGLGG